MVAEAALGRRHGVAQHWATASFRADAARGNYSNIDRPDLQSSAKEISRAMSDTTKKVQGKIVRIATYLQDPLIQRVQHEFKFESLDTLTVHTHTQVGQVIELHAQVGGVVVV